MPGPNRVTFVVGEHNGRSQVAVQKIGARLEGPIERQWPDGVKYRSLVYRLRKGKAVWEK